MANDVKITIKLNPDAEVSRFGDVYVDNPNKVANTSYSVNSSGKYNALPKSTQQDVEGLSWARGYLVFNSSGYLANADTLSGALTSEQNPQELVWGATDSNGYYEVTITFKNASNMENLIVYGDEVSNQFPTMAYVDNSSEPIYNSELKWTIPITKANEHSVRFVQWNRANYNAIIDRISMRGDYLFVDKFNGLKSVESLSQSTGQPKDIYYGIVPSDGSVEILDIDGEIEEMVKYEVIPISNMPLNVVIGENQVQSNISQDSDYGNENKLLKISLTNKLNNWQGVRLVEQKPDRLEVYNLYDMLNKLLVLLGYSEDKIKDMLSKQIVYGYSPYHKVGTIEEYLKNIAFFNNSAYTTASSIYDAIQEICTIAQLNVFSKDNGEIEFVSARPKAINNETFISIPKRCQQSPPERDLFLKNKYRNVKYTKNNISPDWVDILNDKYYIRNNDNTFNATAISDDAQIITDGRGIQFVCFFKTISSSSMIQPYRKNREVAFWRYEYFYPNTSSRASFYGGNIKYSNQTKESFKFYKDEMVGECVRLSSYSSLKSETFAFTIPVIDYQFNSEYTNVLQLSLKLTEYNLSSEDVLLNNENNIYEFTYQEGLLSNQLKCLDYGYGLIDMYDMITNNIIDDYQNGISTTTLSVVCQDYYDTNGDLAVDWSKGEILRVGDIVQVDKDNNGTSAVTYANGEPMRFKITGRTFRKVGVPMIDLELQEVKLVQV